MPKRLLKYKNYDVHSVTTMAGTSTENSRYNGNIVTWLMQTDMKSKTLAVALYCSDYTIELVRESGILNINLLATNQARLVRKLGQQSGRTTNKFSNLAYEFDDRGCPYLTESIGFVQCRVTQSINAGDHDLFICEVLKQVVLNPDKEVLTYNFLRGKKLVRG